MRGQLFAVETVVDVNRASIRQRRRPSCLDVSYAIDRTRDSLERVAENYYNVFP